jgi:hypothetical protein
MRTSTHANWVVGVNYYTKSQLYVEEPECPLRTFTCYAY